MTIGNLVAAGVLVAVLAPPASAAPCTYPQRKTELIQQACERGGQEAAKEAMKAFSKEHGIKSCNTCHAKLAPNYPLKPDGLDQFAKLGGKLLGAAAPAQPPPPPTPTPAPTPAWRPPVPAPAATRIPEVAFEKYALDNGLEVILIPSTANPSLVTVSVWYHVGSGYETYGKSGFAHLFEHMMFQGSRNVGEDRHFSTLKSVGESGVNGTTNPDRTNYFETVPANQLETALWLESDRMGFLLEPPLGKDGKPIDFKTSLDNQIEVVRNERRQRYDNRAYGKALFARYAALYPERHPYRYLTIGRHEDLVAASVDDVKQFFRTWYVPANATLAISGDFDPAAAKRLVTKWFGSFPKSVKPKPVAVPAPVIRSSETVVADSFAKLRQITFEWHSPANRAPGDAELDIVADALGREGTGRLYKALVYDRPLAQDVDVSQGGAAFSGTFAVTVTLRSEASLDEVKRIVAAEVARVTTEELAPVEVSRTVTRVEAQMIRTLETTLGRAELLQRYNHYLGEPDRARWDLDRYRTATPAQIRATAAQYLVPGRVAVVITNPEGAGK